MALAWAGDDILAEIASNFCMGPHTEEGEASHTTYRFNSILQELKWQLASQHQYFVPVVMDEVIYLP